MPVNPQFQWPALSAAAPKRPFENLVTWAAAVAADSALILSPSHFRVVGCPCFTPMATQCALLAGMALLAATASRTRTWAMFWAPAEVMAAVVGIPAGTAARTAKVASRRLFM